MNTRCPQCGWSGTDKPCKHNFTGSEIIKSQKSIAQQVIDKIVANAKKQLEKQTDLFKENK